MNEPLIKPENEYQQLVELVGGAYNAILINRKMIYEIARTMRGIIPKEKWDALNQKLVSLSANFEEKSDDKY